MSAIGGAGAALTAHSAKSLYVIYVILSEVEGSRAAIFSAA